MNRRPNASETFGVASASILFTACTIGPFYSLRVRTAPPVTGSLLDDRRLILAFGESRAHRSSPSNSFATTRWPALSPARC